MNNHQQDYVWWKHGIFYHIYPRSFFDSNSDGIGDLQGIIEQLPYLTRLGVNAIWLSPVYPSGGADGGYDVVDYCAIDPVYGSMDDFDDLLNKCHSRGIKVVMDMVLNHTSNQHPWFIESASGKENAKRDWYLWKPAGKNKKPVNNWRSAFGGSAWQYHKQTDSFYLHSFYPEQPDLNWRNPDVLEEFMKVMRFWLDKGVDGFRFDVINMIVKDKKFRSNPFVFHLPFLQRPKYSRNRPRTFKIIKQIRELTDSYPGDRVCIGEIYVMPPGSPKTVSEYTHSKKKRLHLAFDFALFFKRFSARNYYRYIRKWHQRMKHTEWACHVFSNHDLGRSFNRFPLTFNKEEKARLTAVFMMTIPGTPFIYYGEEIGMRNVRIARKEIKDRLGKRLWPLYSGRDNCRTPMQWSAMPYAGFSRKKPWLPVDSGYKKINVNHQENQSDSLLNLYRELIRLRHRYSALQKGIWKSYRKGRDGVLAYFRYNESEKLMIILNYNKVSRTISLPDNNSFQVLLSDTQSAVGKTLSSEVYVERLGFVILLSEDIKP